MDDDILEILSGKLTLRDLAVREIKYLREKIVSRDRSISQIGSDYRELNSLTSGLRARNEELNKSNADLLRENQENARIIGMSAEREMTLLARIEALETNIASLRAWQEINS